MNEEIKIVQWNCRSLPKRWGDFNNFARSYDIACLGETWLRKGQKYNVKGYNTVRFDRDLSDRCRGGGVAFFIRSSIKYTQIFDLNFTDKFEWIAVKLDVGDSPLYIVNIYRAPNIYWMNLEKVIICGDVNTQHHLWGSDSINQAGKNLVDALAGSSLNILNTGERTRFDGGSDTFSVPDITLASPSTAINSIWSVLSDPMGSDHCPISIVLHASSSRSYCSTVYYAPMSPQIESLKLS